jgi:multiple sugar transport system ATP-binding protein
MAQVVVEDLAKAFEGPRGGLVRAVEGLSFSVGEKELLVLAGPSGCGKTTTLRLIAGLETPARGAVSIGGREVTRLAPGDRDVAMVFQHDALYPHMSAGENIAFPLRVRHVAGAEIESRVRQVAALFGLEGFLERKPGELSGGERRRVALARAMIRRPGVFLFDEPLSNLDPQLRARLRGEIMKLQQGSDAAIIYVTHDQMEAMALGDRIAVMKDGVIQQIADPTTLYEQPANRFVAGFIGSPPMNFLEGSIERNGKEAIFRARAGGAAAEQETLTIPIGTECFRRLVDYQGVEIVLGIRPEHFQFPQAGAASTGGDFIEASIEYVESLGSESHIHLNCLGHSMVARVGATFDVRPREKSLVSLDLSRASLFDPSTEKAIG